MLLLIQLARRNQEMNKFTTIKGAKGNQITLSPTLAQRQAELQADKERRFKEIDKIAAAALKKKYQDQIAVCQQLVQRIQDKLQSEVNRDEVHYGHIGSLKAQE